MTGASKILTVSYGTFSCTLEGFDDPFSTMKAIAEYFRDLAADDRYFGAEPPTPDTAMLHRIAEGAAQRRVQAEVQENGILLRQGAAMPTEAAPPVPAPALLDDTSARAEEGEAAARLARLRAEIDEKSKALEAIEASTPAPAPTPAPEASPPEPSPPEPSPPEPSPIAATAAIETLLQAPTDSYIEDAEQGDSMPPADLGAIAGEAIAKRRVIKPDPSIPVQTIRGGTAPQVEALPEAAPEAAPQPAPAPAPASSQAPAPETPKYRVEVIRGARNGDELGKVEAAKPPAAQALASGPETPPATRIIRIRRVAQTGGITNAPLAAPAPAPLSAEAEAALAAELAALDGAAPPLSPAVPRAKINPSEATLDKLVARANSDLADDNVRRRQAAMAHLKAAAQATKAEREAGTPSPQDSALDTYRQTMDKVAPEGGPRPAPLVLVSQQRIDGSKSKRSDTPLKLAPAPAENIFRASDDDDDLSGPQSNVFTGMETFEDFADRLGASEQIELMEAAAIYVAHVEKQPLFRRRQLIRHMSSLPDALPMTREASVQIFNQLLAMGRFSEMEPGLFAVTDRSPLLAEALREAI